MPASLAMFSTRGLKPFARWNSSLTLPISPINLVVLPVSKSKKFIYYNYHPSYKDSTYVNVLELNKAQLWATKAFTKLQTSYEDMKLSRFKWVQATYNFTQKLVDRINWFETCLASVPSKTTILRELKHIKSVDPALLEKHNRRIEILKQKNINIVTPHLVHPSDVGTNQLNPIPVYYPGSIVPLSDVTSFLSEIQLKYYKAHRKSLIYCAIGIPLSLPFALVPIIPNIPGFYLAYRVYCHFTVLQGLNHLKYLQDSNHLEFIDCEQLNQIYSLHDSLLDQNVVDQVCRIEGFHMKPALQKVLVQEK